MGIWKDVNFFSNQENENWHTLVYLLEWIKWQKAYNTKFIKYVKQQELSNAVDVNWTVLWRTGLYSTQVEDEHNGYSQFYS